MKRTTSSAAALLVALWPLRVLAGSSDKETDDAERLFREAQKLMAQQRFGQACPKLEAVYAKDHELGTLLNLAYCHKMQGASWQSWLEFKEAELKATALNRPERRDFARKRMAELEKSLVRVVVDVPANVELTEVQVEERHVPEAEKGALFAAETGPRKVTFRAKGKKPLVQLVTFVKAATPQHLAVPPLEDESPPPPPPVVAVEPPPPAPAPAPEPVAPPPPEKPTGSSQRTVALVLAGVGAAGIAAGAVTGAITLSNACSTSGWGSSKCPTDPAARKAEKDDGRTTGRIADVSFAVGGAALVAAVVVWLLAPPRVATSGVAPPRRFTVAPAPNGGWATLQF